MVKNNNQDVNLLHENINLTPEDIRNLNQNLDEIKEIYNSTNFENDFELSSFDEAFPQYPKSQDQTGTGIFKTVRLRRTEKTLSEDMENSGILKKLLEEKGLVDYLNLFKESTNPALKKSSESLLKEYSEQLNNTIVNKPLGELGEMTINEALNQGVKIIGPLQELLNNSQIDVKDLAGCVTFLYMYHRIVKTHAYIMKNYSPSKEAYIELSKAQQLDLNRIWVKGHRRFTLLAAPILVAVLYTIKQVTMSPQIKINVDSNSDNFTTNNMAIGFLGFFQKLPYIIGNFVIAFCILSLIKSLTGIGIYSINTLDPIYIQIFNILAIIVLSIFCLDYLLKYLIFIFFNKYNNFSISKKLPQIVYDYLDTIQRISRIDPKYSGYFLINVFIYLTLIIINIIMFFIL